jgi:glutamyl-tRNA synthetase
VSADLSAGSSDEEQSDLVAPRVRFAPSPTGYFHVGGARTALWNWLFARQHGGTFVLRIEDTDTDRNQEEWVDGIISALTWLGITWDEGPHRQSQRGGLYRAAASKLWASGHLYVCDCTREAVEERTKGKPTPGYDGFCRDRGLEPGPGRAMRFRVPDEGTTIVHDLIRGDVEFANHTIEDFIVVRSNGAPLFVLAVVVDDIDMRITHIIRGEEHLPTTPKALMLWKALKGPQLPVFAHVPLLVNENRQKLSKRRDRVALEDYRAQGYLAEAMRNFLVILGWSPGDGQEFLSVEEMIAEFRLEDVNSSPAFFDVKKLSHFNGVYIRQLNDAEFAKLCRAWLEAAGLLADDAVLAHLAPLTKERVTTLAEIPGYLEFALVEDLVIDEVSYEKAIAGDPMAEQILVLAISRLAEAEFDPVVLKFEVEAIAEVVERKLAKAQAPIRVATMGRTVGLPLFESLAVLGRRRTLARLHAAVTRLRGGGIAIEGDDAS